LTHYFHSRLGPAWIPQKHTGRHYTKFVFLHLVGSTGHVVHSSSSGAQNINALFPSSGWHGPDPTKKRARICHVVRSGASRARNVTHYLSFPVGPDIDPTKNVSGHAMQTCVFASGGIYGSRSAFWFVRGAKHQRTISLLGLAWSGSHKKAC
jgi:hypothetical protein